jgi:bifunctional non-homologous end joining protein LigD
MNRKTVANQLPRFVAPMLAKPGRPFDSADHLFEIKWDGTRMLAAIDRGGYRLVNRHGRERTAQYPEFECLREFPAGMILDGEMIVLEGGKPAFGKLLTREQTQDPLKIRMLARSLPAVYVAFDLLYADYEPLFEQPLERRRERLQKLVEEHKESEVVFSASVVGQGPDRPSQRSLSSSRTPRGKHRFERWYLSQAFGDQTMRLDLIQQFPGSLRTG